MRAQNGDVIYTMIDQVSADRVVLIHRERDFHFRPHTIHAGDQHRIAQPGKVCPKQSPEPANLPENLRPVGLPNESWKVALKPIPKIDINARRRVGFFRSLKRFHRMFWKFLRQQAAGEMTKSE